MVPGDDDIQNDDLVEQKLSRMMNAWAMQMMQGLKAENFEYRITNVEHTFLPPPAMGPGNPVVYIVLNIEYSI